jgi:anti-sigma regulatory factor (Ser/Thr protein kinase)
VRTQYTHTALLYKTPDEFVASLVPFVLQGIQADEFVLVVTDSDKGQLLRERLGSATDYTVAEDVDVYTSPGRTLAGYIDTVRESTSNGRSMRVAGEPIWAGLSTVEVEEWTCVEAACNVAFADSQVTMLCPYDVSRLDPKIVEAARRTHPRLQTTDGLIHSSEFVSPSTHQSTIRGGVLPAPSGPVEEISLTSSTALSGVRWFVQRYARNHSMPAERAEDLALAVSELATNGAENGVGPVRVRIWSSGDAVVCDVESRSWFAVSFAGLLPPEPTAPRGRGIWIAGQFCDSLAIRSQDGVTTARVQIATPPTMETTAATACSAIEELLGVFVLGGCSHAEEQAVLAHLATCSACRAEERRLGQVVSRMLGSSDPSS